MHVDLQAWVKIAIQGLLEMLVRGWIAQKDGVYEGFEHA